MGVGVVVGRGVVGWWGGVIVRKVVATRHPTVRNSHIIAKIGQETTANKKLQNQRTPCSDLKLT